MARTYPPATVRFWERVALPRDDNACLIWLGGLGAEGYGSLTVRGASTHAHRYAYELAYGPPAPGLVVDHLCRVRDCVRPSHLEAVTHVENVRRGEVGRNHRVKTACPQGHPYDAANTYVDTHGRRVCRACKRAHAARYYRQKRTP